MKISKELYTFFKEWLEWAESGGEGSKFYNGVGLCSNSTSYTVKEEIRGLFSDHYPFGEDDYAVRRHNDTMHECPKRLAFVREQVKKYEEA